MAPQWRVAAGGFDAPRLLGTPVALEFSRPPSHLCLLRLSAIGDVCHTVPVLRALQDAWPQTQITWVIGRVEHQLVGDIDGVEFVVFDKSTGRAGLAELSRTMQGRDYPLLLHMHASMRANFVSRRIPARIRLGFDKARARDFQWLFTNQRIEATKQQHVMDGLMGFATALGLSPGPPRWDIPVSEQDLAFAAQVTARKSPTLVISPCSGQRARNFRNWQAARYAEVAAYAQSQYGARIVLTGGPSDLEREYGEQICARLDASVKNLIGATTLKQLMAILMQATVVLCPDSGPAHMANAAGTPVVGLYATSNRLRTGPYHYQHLVADRYPDAVQKAFGKSVQQVAWGRRVRDPDAMDLISVADVTARVEQMLAGRLRQS